MDTVESQPHFIPKKNGTDESYLQQSANQTLEWTLRTILGFRTVIRRVATPTPGRKVVICRIHLQIVVGQDRRRLSR
jgi:hypothetical protein